MKATGALPTEERVIKMNDYQWLWYYFNIIEEKKQEFERQDKMVDYMTYFMNFELAKSVNADKEKNKEKSKYEEQNISNADEYINDTFEDEIKELMGDNFVELPSENYKVTTESKEDFLDRALMFEQLSIEDPDNEFIKEIKPQRKQKPIRKTTRFSNEGINNLNDDDLDIIFTNNEE